MKRETILILTACVIFTLRGNTAGGESSTPVWLPKEALLSTRWAKDVSPENAHPEYPRPHLAREAWMNLNGVWEFAITPRSQTEVAGYHQAIRVPFPPESALSGIQKSIGYRDSISS